jgi:multidrug efflux pump subunit AcrB
MGISGRIARFFLESRLTPLIALAALLLGAFAVFVTPREEEPQIDVTMANVLVPFPGASARDVETLIAIPAEQVISQIPGLDHVYSVSKPGLAIITAQFQVGVPRITALVRLHDTILSNRDWLPAQLGVGEPLIKPKGIDDVPVLTLTLWTRDEARGAYDLERIAHAIEIELKRVPGTREVTTIGGPGRVVRVVLDPDRLAAFGLTTADLRRILQGANVALPSGAIDSDNRSIDVETGQFLVNARDVASLVVGAANGNPVYLSDIASILDGPPLPARYVWLGTGPGAATKGIVTPGEFPAVTITITKKPGENAVDVANRLVARIGELQNAVIPANAEVTVTRNYGETANDKAQKLIQKLVFATLSVVVLVFVTLGRREAVIVGAAVVLTLAATLFASWIWGFTLNRVSLFALIFSIGILVDDAIVVVENIVRHLRMPGAKGRSITEVAVEATDEVGNPTILVTFAVIAAIVPMGFVGGLMGPYMRPIPIGASAAMMFSLLVAFTVSPWAVRRLFAKAPAK